MGSFAAALYDALLSAGISADRARRVVDLFDRSVDERYEMHVQTLATKNDIAVLNNGFTGLGNEFKGLRNEFTGLAHEFKGVRNEFTGLRNEFKGLRAEFTGLQSEFSNARNEFAELRADFAELRADFAEHRMATKNDLVELRENATRVASETNLRVARLETRVAETKSDLVKWMLAALTTQTALLLALKLI